ncbi:MAG: transposase [Candidatus Omnitrophica bacterium]|nr:transposase [Candidatus Omnitrophota bacterium]
MSRIARLVAVNYPHHVVQRGNNKQAVFFDDDDRVVYLELLRKYSSRCNCEVCVYCLMKNHIHSIITPFLDNSLSKMMQKISLIFTQYSNKKYKKTGRLWECRYYSSIIEKEEYLWAVSRYIERNPVRAKLVSKPYEYRWSTANNSIIKDRYSFIKQIWHNRGEREAYENFLNMPDNRNDVKKIEKATFKGVPIGTEKFINEITGELGVIINQRPVGRPKIGMCPELKEKIK